MRRPIVATVLTVAFLTCSTVSIALAQTAPAPRNGIFSGLGKGEKKPPALDGSSGPAKVDNKVVPANRVPDLVEHDKLGEATVPLPAEPIEPYLLTKENGPFMVMAHTFRGPNADKYAQALAMELRRDYGLKAYVCRIRDIPMKSYVYGVPPTAPVQTNQPNVNFPEKIRTTDEAGVFVGDCKTVDESDKLWHQVKKLKPVTVDGVPTVFGWRKGQGLSRAMKTTNPFVPAQYLYPRKADPLIKQMNGGPHSIFGCTGRYTLQIAEFTGRTTIDDGGRKAMALRSANLKDSPLATAADDAERMAANLAKDPEIQKTGYKPYVYHDRFASRVTMGSFSSPDDPAAAKLREKLNMLSAGLNNKKVTDVLIVPGAVIQNPAAIDPAQAQK